MNNYLTALPSATNPLSKQVHSQQPAWSDSNIAELAASDSSNDLLYNLHNQTSEVGTAQNEAVEGFDNWIV